MTTDTTHLKILICDDSVTNILILTRLLESEGYFYHTSLTDPTRVLSAMQENSYDLLSVMSLMRLRRQDPIKKLGLSKRLLSISRASLGCSSIRDWWIYLLRI